MKTGIKFTLSSAITVCAFVMSIFASYQVFSFRSEISELKKIADSNEKLKKTISDLGSQFTRINRQLKISDLESSKRNAIPQGVSHDSSNQRTDQNIERLSRMDPGVLDSIDKKYQLEAKAKEHQAMLIQRKIANQKADVHKYGRGVLELARKAIGNSQDSDAAYKKLTTEYADTSVAGSVIAERALMAAIDLNTQEVEEYYNQLTSNAQYKESVTEQGIEATPALQGYLARQYISTGRFEEADTLIQSLSTDYGSQYVPEKGEGSRPEWQTGNDIATQLRQELQNATSGHASGR